jgi:hypothetical protein
MKLDEFRKLAALPTRVGVRSSWPWRSIRRAPRSPAARRERVVGRRRHRTGPGPRSFREYVYRVAAEFSPAQGVYVETRSGGSADRSAGTAAGRPVLVQGHGVRTTAAVGEGLLAFTSLDDAAAGACAIAGDRGRHGRAARAIAEEHFDSDKVLRRFLEQALA